MDCFDLYSVQKQKFNSDVCFSLIFSGILTELHAFFELGSKRLKVIGCKNAVLVNFSNLFAETYKAILKIHFK